MLSHLKRRVAQLTVLMLAAMTLALVPASPAYAAVKVPLANAQFSACPTSAGIPSAGFTDTTSTDVDCVAYYGITTGTTATTYSPTESVTRWQMALFLTRAAVPAGVTLGAGTDDGTFTDVSGKSAEIITAIYQIKELGITIGTTATTFSPDDNVSREEMALFINRFLAKAELGPGGANDSVADDDGLMGTNVGSASTTTNYTDIGTGTTYEGRNAITNLWHMGITDDPSSTSTVYSTTFSPAADMTRSAMATFLTEALAHTNARPKGVTLQSADWDANGSTYATATGYAAQGASETPILSASYRDDSFGWAAGTLIDVWSWKNSTTAGAEQYLSTGLCNSTLSGGHAASAESVTICYIDAGDQATNSLGNTTPSGTLQAENKDYSYVAWTAAAATSYDDDLHTGVSDTSTITVTGAYDADDLQISSDIDPQALTASNASTVPFGEDITISLQAEDTTSGIDANTTEALVMCSVAHTRTIDDSPVSTYADGTVVISTTTKIYTDATGLATFTITAPEELAALTGTATTTDQVTDAITVTCADGINDGSTSTAGTTVADWGTAPASGSSGTTTATKSFVYKDTVDAMASAALAQSAYYGTASTSGVTRTATYTAYDQYGDPWAGEVVTLSSSSSLIMNPYGGAGDTFTTDVAHGLAVGDDVTLLDLQGCTLSTVTTAGVRTAISNGHALKVSLVTTSTTFALTDTATTPLPIEITATTCADNTDGVSLATSSFDAVSRTTGSAGTATVTWSDTEGTSGVDTIYGDGASIARISSEYYRTINSTTVANTTALTTSVTDTIDDWTIESSADAALGDVPANELGAWIEYWDDTNDVLVVGLAHAEANTAQRQVHYAEYAYDSNDQFTYSGVVTTGTDGVTAGTANTMVYWEYYLRLNHSNSVDNWAGTGTGVLNQGGPVHIDYDTDVADASVFILG
jgi:hypothetical protein